MDRRPCRNQTVSPLLKNICLRYIPAALLLCTVATPRASLAQELTPAPEESSRPQSFVEEVVVTARKRAETVQEVPVTVGVVNQDAISSTGSSTLLQLPSVAPGINLAKAPTGNEVGITIRGLGSSPGVPSFDSSVSLFVDGVYAPRSREFAASMFDVERIEVIRGTQAALLGKNTSLGAINLITRKPGESFALDLRSSYEFEEETTLFSGGADVPFTDEIRARISGQITDDNGWVRNTVTNLDAPRTKTGAIRGVLVWSPLDILDLTALVQHDVSRNRASPVEQIATTGLPELLATISGHPGAIETRLDRKNALSTPSAGGEQWERLEVDRYSLTANLTLAEHTITSITAYSKYTNRNLSDGDMVPGDFLTRGVDEKSRQFSQELRIVSSSGKAFDYVLGALYLDGRLRNNTTWSADYPFGPAPGVAIKGAFRTDFVQNSDAQSVFAQGNYGLTDAVRLTAGARWTREKKSVDLGRSILEPGFFSLVVFPPEAPFSLDRVEKNFDYSLGAQYQLADDAMIYASYGKGTKGGGYAQSVTQLETAEYAKEKAETVELGVKLAAPDRSWLFNIAGFNTLVDDFQLVTFTGAQFVVGNTDLRSRGFEIESYWFLIPDFRVFLNITYADAEDRNTKNPIPLAPKWTGNAGFGYRAALNDWLVFKADGSIDYRSKRFYQQDPATSPAGGAFASFNLGLAVGAANDQWEIRVLGRNLSDEIETAFGFPTPFLGPGNQSAIAERGRTVAVQLSAKF